MTYVRTYMILFFKSNYACIYVLILIVNSGRPSLKDLQRTITSKYAAQWKAIDTQLGINYGSLQIIESNFPSDVSRWCIEMLKKWLQSDCNTTCTWDKIWKAVKSPAVTKERWQSDGEWLYA